MRFDRWLDQQLTASRYGAATQLAKALGITPDKVTKMRRGLRQPQAHELRRIEQFFGKAAPAGTLADAGESVSASLATVPIVGYVGAGAVAHRYAVAQGDLDEVPAPLGTTLSTVAVEIRGDSLGAMFRGWLAYYDDIRSPVTDDLIGRLCVVGLDDDRVLIKKVVRSKASPAKFDLESEQGAPIRGVSILWAARVKLLAPR